MPMSMYYTINNDYYYGSYRHNEYNKEGTENHHRLYVLPTINDNDLHGITYRRHGIASAINGSFRTASALWMD